LIKKGKKVMDDTPANSDSETIETQGNFPKTEIGMSELKGYVERVYMVKGKKAPKITIEFFNPAPYRKSDEGAELYF
jgi:hypothetical protein